MITLSYRQPWPTLVALGIKPIENRTWRLPEKYKGKRVLVHASGKPWTWKQFCEYIESLDNEDLTLQKVLRENNFSEKWLKALPTSAIIGSVVISDCVINHPSVWAEQSSGYSQNRSCWPNGLPSTLEPNKAPYIVELERGVYLSDGNGDPARALLRRNALRFRTKTEAEIAILRATKERAFERPQVTRDGAIFNWVLSDPIFFDKPILNVKGRLGFWEYDGDMPEL